MFCSRLGARGDKPRVVLVIMRREDDAVYFTNNGRGRCYFGQNRSDNVWVNPDLTRNEREAMFQQRKERNEKRNRSEPRGRGAINQPNGGVVPEVNISVMPDGTTSEDTTAAVSEEATITGVVIGEAEAPTDAAADQENMNGESNNTDTQTLNQDGVGTIADSTGHTANI